MKKLIILAALASTVVFAGCERKETVVVPATEPAASSTTIVPVPVPVPVPGPKGDTGATGATGSAGSTTVIVPPAAPAEAPK